MPKPMIRAIALVKKAAALTNHEIGLLEARLAKAIAAAADEVINSKLDADFPLVVWQTGSGTQSNMNVNEVIANRASELLGGTLGSKRLVHANDHVNLGQSSNDVFPTAMHIAAAEEIAYRLNPALARLYQAFKDKAEAFQDILKIGRTHTSGRNATDSWPGIRRLCAADRALASNESRSLMHGALWTRPRRHGRRYGAQRAAPVRRSVAAMAADHAHQVPFVSAENKFEALAAHDAIVLRHGALNTVAVSPMQDRERHPVARLGPRSGLRRADPAGERAGLVDHARQGEPTQCEAVTMVAAQVFGNHRRHFCRRPGHLELNVFNPVIAYDFLQSVRLLADAAVLLHARNAWSASRRARDNIKIALERSLMLVTAPRPYRLRQSRRDREVRA